MHRLGNNNALAIAALLAIFTSMAGGATYVGAAVCGNCHAAEYQKWSQARHAKMLQPATASSVEGDFARAQIKLRDQTYRLREKNGIFYITESYLSGEVQEHRIDYTLGSRRIQHYLTTLTDGRIIVLPPSWDVQRKEWFHNLDIVNPEETTRVLLQVWNKSCYSCHVSQEEKRFDGERSSYRTRWLDFGTNCERCHGPGSEHVATHTQGSRTPDDIVVQTRLNATRNTMICAQCHSLRDIVAEGYQAGSDYNDYFLPILEYGQKVDPDPAYWPDGRTRRFSNDAIGFWQSECFLKGGATCLDCHNDVHDPEIEKNAQLRSGANALCINCHRSIGEAVSKHTHHPTGSSGSSCVECHMPRTVFSIRAAIRDHSMSVPVPENSIRFGIPNACNVCHQDQSAEWALKQMNVWYGDQSRQKLIRRATAFSQARAGDRAAIGKLLDILADPAEGFLMRANAVGHLSRFSDETRVRSALELALKDREPLVRAVAALRIKPARGDAPEVVSALIRGLADPVRTVRVGAALSLVNLGMKRIAGDDEARFYRAMQEVRNRYAIQSDDAQERLNAGKFHYLTGDSERALDAFQSASRLDPQLSVKYFVACALAQEGKVNEARKRFRAIPPSDPYYVEAQQMLKTLDAQK